MEGFFIVLRIFQNACPPTGLTIGATKHLYWSPIKISDITWNFNKFLLDKNGIPR